MPLNFAQWNVGDIILDLYKVTDILGEGGFGKVYKVRHQGWNIDLAVKIPKPEIVEAAGGVENFEREAETWVNLGLHPHTVSCYYVRQIDSNPVVFAEYVAGGSLHDWIYSRSLYAGETETSLKRIIDIGIQFAWGLHYAHEQGLIHQDVKPANVMMTAEGLVKVTDFGLANALTNNQEREPQANRVANSTLMVAGSGAMTPAYCSPEQANGNNLTRRTDLWSWALSVLEMFQGERTWGHGTVAAGALEYYLESGSEYLQFPQMPILLAQLLRRCFRENPSERAHDMLEVANELQSIYQQVIGEAYPQQQPQTGKDIADSLNNRAVSLFDLGKQEEALQLWEQALQVQPQHPESTYNRGLMLWRSGEINDDTLVEKIEESRKLYSSNWITKYLLSLVHLERDDCQAAIQLLQNIQASGVQDSEVEALLMLAKERLPRSTRLLKIFDEKNVISGSLSANSRFAVFAKRDRTLNLYDVFTGTSLDALDLDNMFTWAAPAVFNFFKIFLFGTFVGFLAREPKPVATITKVCLSADGSFALFRSTDNTLTLWEVATGRCLRTFDGNIGCGNAIYLSADSSLVFAGSVDNTLKLWEVATGHCLRTFNGHTADVSSVCLSADNRFALSASRDNIKLWEITTGLCLHIFNGHTADVNSVCLSEDGHFALSGSVDNTLKLWEVATGHCLRTFNGHTADVNSVCLSADSRFALSVALDNTFRLWEIATGRCLRTFETHQLNIDSVSLSADSRFALFVGLDKYPELWWIGCFANSFTAPLKLTVVVTTETAILRDTAYEYKLQQAQMALAQCDYRGAALHIQEARNQSGYSHRIEAVNAWTSLYVHLPHLSLQGMWESKTFIKRHTDSVLSACLSPDSRFALFGCSGESGGTLKLWEIATEKYLRTFKGHTSGVCSVSVNADSRFALSGSADNTLKLWEIATGRCLRTFEGHKNSVNSVCLSADSRLALSGSADNTLKLWEISTGFCLRTFKGHQKPITTVCLGADSRLALSGSEDNTFRLWEISTGRCLRTFEGHKSGIKSVCLSADSQMAISGSRDSTLKLWEISTGRCLRTFEGHKSGIKSVCLSADNRLAMSASELDDTFKVWEISTGSCLYSFSTHRTNLLCLSADSRFALCCGNWDDFTIWILDWELELQKSGDWDEGARHYLDKFLTLHTPYAAALSQNRKPSNKEITLALTRRGTPTWTEEDFQNLLYTLSCVGYGWLSPATVHHQLQVMVRDWERRKPRTTIHYILPSLYVQTRDLFNQTRDVFQSKHFKIFSLSWIICILILSVFFLPPTSNFSVFIVIGLLFVIYTLIKQLYAS